MAEKSPVIIDLKFDPNRVARSLEGAFPGREVINLADSRHGNRDLSDAHYAVLWNPDPDLFTRAPNLKVLFSGGAGVDRILSLPGLPDLPIVRFVDRTLTTRMSEWIVLQCLTWLRQVPAYAAQQKEGIWRDLAQPEACEVTVGVMGLGVLGLDAVEKLRVMGFEVRGWSRSLKRIKGVETFAADGLDAFLAGTDILVGLLPLTPETTGFYNAGLFSRLRKGGALGKPVFINAGRGKSQVEADIVAALGNGTLGGVSLDVFDPEPLPSQSPLWSLPTAIITPHTAASSDERALFRNAFAQIERYESGHALDHLVDRSSGY